MKKIIIDTDPGHDDAMAIMLAVLSNKFDILAITTVMGNSSVENTTRNARYILKLLNQENIPIYSGADKPLVREHVKAIVHGTSGLEGIDPQNESKLTGNAVDKIIELIAAAEDGTITLVTLGPLTNIAKAIQKDPKVMSSVKEIVMMGGAISVPGNQNRVAEFNLYVDPEAADIVFHFPVAKVLVPLDACNNVRLNLKNFQTITGSLRDPLLKMAKPYMKNLAKEEGEEVALMYDPLTIFYLIKPESCKTREYNLQVETKGELTRGMTVADFKFKEKENIEVVVSIDSHNFKKLFFGTLNKLT